MTSPIHATYAVSYRVPIGHEPLNGLVSEIFSVKVADTQTDRHVDFSLSILQSAVIKPAVIFTVQHGITVIIDYRCLSCGYFSAWQLLPPGRKSSAGHKAGSHLFHEISKNNIYKMLSLTA